MSDRSNDGVDLRRGYEGGESASWFSHSQALWMLGLLALPLVLLSLSGESGRLLLRYERHWVLQGEYWRLITGHLVHASWRHMWVNVAALALMFILFPRHYRWREWLLIGVLGLLAIDVGFVFWEPQVEWYVGLSGVLHGTLAAGAVAWWRHDSKLRAALLSLILLAKLTWEQTHGGLSVAGALTVVVDAHLLGAIGGATAGVLLWLYSYVRPSRGADQQ